MAEWEDELDCWLKPFLDRLGHKDSAADVSAVRNNAVLPSAGIRCFVCEGEWRAAKLDLSCRAFRISAATSMMLSAMAASTDGPGTLTKPSLPQQA